METLDPAVTTNGSTSSTGDGAVTRMFDILEIAVAKVQEEML